MDLLKSYSSDCSDSDSTQTASETLSEGEVRSVYLVTYSQADIEKFSSRRDFATVVLEAFSTTKAQVLQWCCCREKHQRSGEHYHLALKLDRNQRWIAAKEYLLNAYNISVHFSNRHHNYYSAWCYVTKCDANFEESEGHPDLSNSSLPQTSAASVAKRVRKRQRQEVEDIDSSEGEEENVEAGENNAPQRRSKLQKKRKKRLTAFEVSEIIVEKEVKTLTELQALAYAQKQEGKTDVAEFLINRSPRVVSDVLNSAWQIENATQKLARSKKTRMELLQEASTGECIEGCNGQWLRCALEILDNNGVLPRVFSEAVRDLISKGHGKYRNIMIVGPANCGKTFLLNPLTILFETFCNPASGSFAWVGVDNTECIFLNDFRWSPQIIPWHDLLLMLEGHIVHLPAPKTHFAKDICFERDTPIFCTGKSPIIFIKNGMIDNRETDMMACRWRVFYFNYQIPRKRQREIPPCSKCFCNFILNV